MTHDTPIIENNTSDSPMAWQEITSDFADCREMLDNLTLYKDAHYSISPRPDPSTSMQDTTPLTQELINHPLSNFKQANDLPDDRYPTTDPIHPLLNDEVLPSESFQINDLLRAAEKFSLPLIEEEWNELISLVSKARNEYSDSEALSFYNTLLGKLLILSGL